MVRSLRLWPALLAVLTSTTIRERRNRQASPADCTTPELVGWPDREEDDPATVMAWRRAL
jgi:hypothetical protein